jgi:periplasmic protein TonB
LRVQARVQNPPTVFTPIKAIDDRVEHAAGGSGGRQPATPTFTKQLLQPGEIPKGRPNVGDDDGDLYCPDCTPGFAGIPGIAGPSSGPQIKLNVRPVEQLRPRISEMQAGAPTHRVQPVYPHHAKLTRTQGEVLLTAIISRDGAIESLQVRSGHPLLAKAALDAVRQWRYRPYVLNGAPIEVETQIRVTFRLEQ